MHCAAGGFNRVKNRHGGTHISAFKLPASKPNQTRQFALRHGLERSGIRSELSKSVRHTTRDAAPLAIELAARNAEIAGNLGVRFPRQIAPPEYFVLPHD